MSHTPVLLVVAGKVDDKEYQMCRVAAENIASTNANFEVELRPMMETDWEEYIRAKSAELGEPAHRMSPLVYYNGIHYVGGTSAFFQWALQVYKYREVLQLPHMRLTNS